MLFEGAVLLGSNPNELPLATRTKIKIENEIIPEPDAAELLRLSLFAKDNGSHWEPRKPHQGGYNCAGHVFASRRTAILAEKTVLMVLKEDGYRSLGKGEKPMQGDIVLYWGRPSGGTIGWLHVGMLCEFRFGEGSKVGIPWVISKFGSTCGEWLHRLDDVPYEKMGYIDVKSEYRTDRPPVSSGHG